MDAFYFCLDCKKNPEIPHVQKFLPINRPYIYVAKIFDVEAPRASDFAPGLETDNVV